MLNPLFQRLSYNLSTGMETSLGTGHLESTNSPNANYLKGNWLSQYPAAPRVMPSSFYNRSHPTTLSQGLSKRNLLIQNSIPIAPANGRVPLPSQHKPNIRGTYTLNTTIASALFVVKENEKMISKKSKLADNALIVLSPFSLSLGTGVQLDQEGGQVARHQTLQSNALLPIAANGHYDSEPLISRNNSVMTLNSTAESEATRSAHSATEQHSALEGVKDRSSPATSNGSMTGRETLSINSADVSAGLQVLADGTVSSPGTPPEAGALIISGEESTHTTFPKNTEGKPAESMFKSGIVTDACICLQDLEASARFTSLGQSDSLGEEMADEVNQSDQHLSALEMRKSVTQSSHSHTTEFSRSAIPDIPREIIIRQTVQTDKEKAVPEKEWVFL